MSGSNRRGDQIRIKSMPGVLAKKFGIRLKQTGVEDLQNTGKINLRVFSIRMIALNKKCGAGQQE